ncbi:hypothetical protein HDU76_007263 [Blyttiomyces sp. JEL0837]|nr:hypothetical protein HDU76_007263 [Blyttiomyces sp. JEL0837]
MLPGTYYITPIDAAEPLSLQTHLKLPLVPSSRSKENSAAGTPTGSKGNSPAGTPTGSSKAPPPILKKRKRAEDVEDTSNSDGGGYSVADSKPGTEAFRMNLIIRDGGFRCGITGDDIFEASHILAWSWWRDIPDRRGRLPIGLVEQVRSMRLSIDGVQNGLLLRTDLAKAFDNGRIAFRYDGEPDRLVCVAVDDMYRRLDGVSYFHTGNVWGERTRPDEELLKFHLQQSVFAQLTASGIDGWDTDCDSDGGDEVGAEVAESPEAEKRLKDTIHRYFKSTSEETLREEVIG